MRTLFFSFLLFPFLTQAAPLLSVEITSFRPAGQRPTTLAAELCGHVNFHEYGNIRVLIAADNDAVAHYMTTVDRDGNFCQVILTYKGVATVSATEMGTAGHVEILPFNPPVKAYLMDIELPIDPVVK